MTTIDEDRYRLLNTPANKLEFRELEQKVSKLQDLIYELKEEIQVHTEEFKKEGLDDSEEFTKEELDEIKRMAVATMSEIHPHYRQQMKIIISKLNKMLKEKE